MTSVKKNIENKSFTIALLNEKTFSYDFHLKTSDLEVAKTSKCELESTGKKCFIAREYPSLGLTASEQIESKNKELSDIKSRCLAINKARSVALKAKRIVIDWYLINKKDIKFKECGDLFSVWDKSLKEELKKAYKNTGVEVSYDWEYSLSIKVKSQARLSNGSAQYFQEFAYICDQDGELSKGGSDFKKVTPIRYLKGLDQLSALKVKQDKIEKQRLDLKCLLGL